MKRVFLSKTVCGLLVSASVLTVSCIDNSYDLTKDIDMTITVGGNLTTPGNSTEQITLEELFDIDYETSDVDTLANGDFVLRIDGDQTHSNVFVNDVEIDPSSVTKESEQFSTSGAFLQKGRTPSMPIEGIDPVWDLKNENVPEDVVDLESAGNISNNDITLRLHLEGNVDGIYLEKGMSFVFPQSVKLSAVDAVTKRDFDIQVVSDPNDVHYGKQLMTLKQDTYMPESGMSWKVQLDSIYFKDHGLQEGEGFDKENHSISFSMAIPLEGNVYLTSEDFPAGSTTAEFTMVCNVSSDRMLLNEVRAMVNPDIDFSLSNIEITSIPDFLQEEGVRLDLANPQVLLDIENSASVTANFNGELSAYKNGQKIYTLQIGAPLNELNGGANEILIEANAMNKLCLSPLSEDIPAGYRHIQVEGLSDLIMNVPDSIVPTNLRAEVLPEFYDMKLGTDYDISTDYQVNAPLGIGSEFNICYSDTIDGWSEDMESFETSEVKLTMVGVNEIPLDLNMEILAIDSMGQILEDVVVDTEGFLVGATHGNPSSQALEFCLKNKNGGKVKNLDGIIIKLTGSANSNLNNETLNTKQSLRLEDFKIHISGGVTLDLN